MNDASNESEDELIPYLAIVDVETTGLSPNTDRILEIAVVLLDAQLQVVEEIITVLNPERSVGATWIHGIHEEDVMDAPLFSDIARPLFQRLEAVSAIVAHNAAFDRNFVNAEFGRCGISTPESQWLCTRRLAPQFLPDLERERLSDCCQHANVQLHDAHSALGDCHAAAGLIQAYQQLNPRLFDECVTSAIPKPRHQVLSFEQLERAAQRGQGPTKIGKKEAASKVLTTSTRPSKPENELQQLLSTIAQHAPGIAIVIQPYVGPLLLAAAATGLAYRSREVIKQLAIRAKDDWVPVAASVSSSIATAVASTATTAASNFASTVVSAATASGNAIATGVSTSASSTVAVATSLVSGVASVASKTSINAGAVASNLVSNVGSSADATVFAIKSGVTSSVDRVASLGSSALSFAWRRRPEKIDASKPAVPQAGSTLDKLDDGQIASLFEPAEGETNTLQSQAKTPDRNDFIAFLDQSPQMNPLPGDE